MKQQISITALAWFVLLTIQQSSSQSGVYISQGTNVFIGAGTLFSMDSLVLLPSVNFNIPGLNAETRSASVTHPTANPYIRRVFHFLATTPPFNGDITIYYRDAELNGITESALTLNVHNGNMWNAFNTIVTRDDVNNFVTTSGLTNLSLNELTLAAFSSPLPVRFTLFNAFCINNTVKLTWKTAQEFNSKNFEIERSVNGTAWQVIGTVNAAGASSTERNYTFTDNSAPGTAFYRLKLHDIDGRTSITYNLRSSCAFPDLFIVYPNPVHDIVFVNINVNAVTKVKLRLYDAKGGLVKATEANLFPGNNQLMFVMKEFPSGNYHLRAQWGNTEKGVNIIKK